MSKSNKPNKPHSHKPLIVTPTTRPEPNVSNQLPTYKVQPDQYSLLGYSHIQNYLNGKSGLTKEEVNAVLRLSQHLRVFGLLSAVGYLNHTKESGKVQEKTSPVWTSLLGQMLQGSTNMNKREMMQKVQQMIRENPREYMMEWSKSLTLSQQWNFWAKAHQTSD